MGVTALVLLLAGDFWHHASAFTSNDLVTGGSVWLETTLVIALSHVSIVAFSLQIARSYFLRTLGKFNLKFSADMWFFIYTLVRDALLILSFIIGLLVFLPGTFLDYPMAVPFMPLAVVFFGAALATKLYLDSDDDKSAYRIVTILVFFGMSLWVIGTVFVTESPLQLAALPAGVSTTSGFWFAFQQIFSSQSNLQLTMVSFEICLGALTAMGLLVLVYGLSHWVVRPERKSSSLPLNARQNFDQVADFASSNTPAKSFVAEKRGQNALESRFNCDDGISDHRKISNSQRSDNPSYIG